MADNVLLRKRLTIETLFDKLKAGMGLEHTRRRSPINALVHVLSCLAATTLAQTKIKIGTLIITDPIPGNHTATLATPGHPTLHLGVGVVSGYPPPRLTLPTPPVGREPVPAKGGTARRSASSSSNGFDSFCRPPSAARPAAGAAVPAAALGWTQTKDPSMHALQTVRRARCDTSPQILTGSLKFSSRRA